MTVVCAEALKDVFVIRSFSYGLEIMAYLILAYVVAVNIVIDPVLADELL